jgi:hypothetical protein
MLDREARGHAVAAIVKQLSDQESLRSGASVAYRGGLRGEAGLNRLEEARSTIAGCSPG